MQSFVQSYGYLALVILSIVESACAPIPSEVTFGFAGALCTAAVTGHAQFSLPWVIVIGTVGSLVGSVIAYEVSRSLGRAIVDRWGKRVLLTPDDLDAAERWFAKYGNASVFFGRILPVVRSAISVPAGIAEMRRGPFMVLTVIGSALWVAVLSGLGYAAGSNWGKVSHDVHLLQWPVIAAVVALLAWGFYRRVRTVRAHYAGQGRGRHAR